MESVEIAAMKFSDFVEEWKQVCRLNVSDGWKYSQDQMIRDYILPIFGHIELKTVTHLHISKLLSDVKSRGRSPQTVKHVYSVINKIFSDAVQHFELIQKSPIKPALHRPFVPHKERDFLTPEEARELLTATREDPQFSLPIWIQTFSGLRIGEVQGLKWGDVDWRNKSFLVRRVFNPKTGRFQSHTKNRTQVRVPIPEPLLELLKERRGAPSAFICTSENGARHFSRHTYAKALPRICKRLGLKELSSHELRHTCSEVWIFHGASAEDIRRLFNHKSLSSTKTYIHRTDSRLQSLSKKVTCGFKVA